MTVIRPKLAIRHFDISLIRILTGFHMLGHWGWEICDWSTYISNIYYTKDARWSVAYFEGWLAFGLILVLHDIFMVTIDVKRTHTYLGCIAAQTVVNLCFTGLIALHLVLWARGGLFSEYLSRPDFRRDHPQYILLVISLLLAGVCSLCLFLVNIPLILALRSVMTMRQSWKINIKDAFVGDTPPVAKVHALSVLGHPREIQIKTRFYQRFIAPGKRALTQLFFRRVSPAESRIYAFSRNFFAVVAIGILIFRTVTALQQAQNEIKTRVTSGTCDNAVNTHRLSLLLDRPTFDPQQSASLLAGINVTVGVAWNNPRHSNERSVLTPCAVEWTQAYNSTLRRALLQNRILELFVCPTSLSDPFKLYFDMLPSISYHVEVLSNSTEILSRAYTDIDRLMPRIWFSNENDYDVFPRNWLDLSETRAYLPPLNLIRGSHIVSETRLITKRFIRSPILKDIIFNLEPDYRQLSLYPIVYSSLAAVNTSGARIATATIYPTLSPGLVYHRNEADFRNFSTSASNICDFIEDYRSSTILDVIGSVGGLFALLQAAHLLLFGRPLFWGLTGAKVITPFGLLGGCGSRGFRHRLKEGYHSKSPEDGADTIQIVRFLQDFVIDFGPADLDPAKPPERDSTRLPLTSVNEKVDDGLDGTRIPLRQMGPDNIVSPRENEVYVGRYHGERSHSYP